MNKLSEKEIIRVRETAEYFGTITPRAIEKDIFVTKAIHAIADMTYTGMNLVFCGGTCLTKAYQIVARMSEDVDFKVFPTIPFVSLSEQRRKLGDFRDKMTSFLKEAGFEITEKNLRSRDNNSYIVYELDYPSHFEENIELRPHIQLEFTLAIPRLPTEIKAISSLTDRIFPDSSPVEKNIACISILETAAEKWVGLTRRIAAISRGHDPIDETLVRHMYDLLSITSEIKLTDDFFHLINDTIEQDRTKFKRHQQYFENPAAEIKHSLKMLCNDPVWSKNYNNFVDAMVFSKNNAEFDKCYEKLKNITEQVLSRLDLQKAAQENILHEIEISQEEIACTQARQSSKNDIVLLKGIEIKKTRKSRGRR